ncbi:MAG: glycogen synthase GlgA [Deltaproteobacteria bacterium]|jgi:starch synthase|nr:glycogen synthase GlgA [Deltaproteobacteria bacterium]
MSNKPRVLLAASEVSPLAQTGGLAEVSGSLPLAFASLGIECSIIMPGYTHALSQGNFTDLGITLPVKLGDITLPAKLYRGILKKNVPIYLIRYDPYFDRPGLYVDEEKQEYPDNPQRFTFFCKAVIQALPHLKEQPPDIILANDWQTGLIMPYLLEMPAPAPQGVFVIHNQGFLGLAPPEIKPLIDLPDTYFGVSGLEYHGLLSFLKAGIAYSRSVVTVSPTYAKEIQTPEFGHGLDGLLREHSFKLHGILNGINLDEWNPATDTHLPANYTSDNFEGKARCKDAFLSYAGLSDTRAPLFGMVSRLTAQKGISILLEAATDIFNLGANLAILGTGEPLFQEQLKELATRYPKNMWLKLAYNTPLSHQVLAASDFILVPSAYEPCGLTQLFALRYGAIPVVRAIGGLNDTVRDFAGQNPDGLWDTGFKFGAFNPRALARACRRASELYYRKNDFITMARSNMREDYSWKTSALSYLSLFLNITKSA